jgi:son of sevenless-like protein
MTKLGNSRSGSGDLSVATTWDTISSELTLALYSLNSSIKRKVKWDYMYHTHVSVHRIKNILKIIELANLSNKDIQADDNATIASSEVSESGDQSSVKFQSNPIISFKDEKLKTLYNDILKQLTQLILYARSASSVWPTPEAGYDLLSISEKTLVLSKSIISRAQELKIQADNPIDDMPDTMNLINMKFETEDQSCELLYKVSSMASEVSYLVTQTRRLITDYPETTLKTSKRLILSVGEILAVVNGFTVNDCNEHLASIFNSDKSRAFEEVGNFVVSLQTKSIHNFPTPQSKNSPSYKTLLAELNQNVLATAARLETAIYRLIISGKILIDDRDQYEQFLLKKEINRFLGNLDSGRPFLGSEKIMNLLDFKPRRPMSMTFHHIPLVSPSIITPFDLEGSSIDSNQNIQRSLSTPANSNPDQTLTSLSGSTTLDQNLAPIIAGRHSSSRSVASSISSMTENFEDMQLPTSIPTIRTNSIRKLEETPWFLKPDYDPDHIAIVDNVVKGGTLNALIERLTSHDHLDTSFIMTFLLTYRTFTNTVEFLDLLFRRYSLTCPIGLQPDDQELWREKKLKPVRLRVFSVLKTWLESFYLEEEDSRGLENLRHFASTTMSESNTASAGVLMKLVRKRKESSDGQFRKMVRSLREAPTPILPKNLSKFKLLDLDPLEIARQLTIVDSRLYNDLKPVEFLNKAWSRKDNISSPNVTRLIERFNQVIHLKILIYSSQY